MHLMYREYKRGEDNPSVLKLAKTDPEQNPFTKLGKYNINVNGIAPEFIQTQMTRETVKKDGMYMDDFNKVVVSQIPVRRLGTTEDVANVALFLASDESSFVSGQTINVRGGP